MARPRPLTSAWRGSPRVTRRTMCCAGRSRWLRRTSGPRSPAWRSGSRHELIVDRVCPAPDGVTASGKEPIMMAVVAAIIFGLALLLDLANVDVGDALSNATLVTAGLFCL